jgi:hypothetical protein
MPTHVQETLAAASAQQSPTRMNDTVGLLLIRLPLTPMSEQNVVPLIAHPNGEQ